MTVSTVFITIIGCSTMGKGGGREGGGGGREGVGAPSKLSIFFTYNIIMT